MQGNAVYYAIGPLRGTGTLPYALPDLLGPCSGSGLQTGSKAVPSIPSGDMYLVYAAGVRLADVRGVATPKHIAESNDRRTNGQADVSTSDYFRDTY